MMYNRGHSFANFVVRGFSSHRLSSVRRADCTRFLGTLSRSVFARVVAFGLKVIFEKGRHIFVAVV
jgi:hypothetical protein